MGTFLTEAHTSTKKQGCFSTPGRVNIDQKKEISRKFRDDDVDMLDMFPSEFPCLGY